MGACRCPARPSRGLSGVWGQLSDLGLARLLLLWRDWDRLRSPDALSPSCRTLANRLFPVGADACYSRRPDARHPCPQSGVPRIRLEVGAEGAVDEGASRIACRSNDLRSLRAGAPQVSRPLSNDGPLFLSNRLLSRVGGFYCVPRHTSAAFPGQCLDRGRGRNPLVSCRGLQTVAKRLIVRTKRRNREAPLTANTRNAPLCHARMLAGRAYQCYSPNARTEYAIRAHWLDALSTSQPDRSNAACRDPRYPRARPKQQPNAVTDVPAYLGRDSVRHPPHARIVCLFRK